MTNDKKWFPFDVAAETIYSVCRGGYAVFESSAGRRNVSMSLPDG